ncbi:hypothetical protein C4K38_4251 [Pseudomonas chlororaphis subsp. piscium]|nr:hypothetical protein C4K38_4251 [Pseudomonas chlororaphis subsp. piscium]
MSPFAGNRASTGRSYRSMRLAHDTPVQPTRTPKHPATFSELPEGPAGLCAACSSGYRVLHQA